VISGFCRAVNEIRTLLGFYTAYIGTFLLTFRDILFVPSSEVKQSKNYHSTLRKIPKERRPQNVDLKNFNFSPIIIIIIIIITYFN